MTRPLSTCFLILLAASRAEEAGTSREEIATRLVRAAYSPRDIYYMLEDDSDGDSGMAGLAAAHMQQDENGTATTLLHASSQLGSIFFSLFIMKPSIK